MKPAHTKMLIVGVGGQGVVRLTNLLIEAARLASLPVATSEVHGLSQRGGSVVAALHFGSGICGAIERGGADFLVALEPLEAERAALYLNAGSAAVIGGQVVPPHSVHVGAATYPDVAKFLEYLRGKIRRVVYCPNVLRHDLNPLSPLNPKLRNIYVLGAASGVDTFPLQACHIEKAIEATAEPRYIKETLRAFKLAREDEDIAKEAGNPV